MKKYYKVVYKESNGDLVSVNRNTLFPEEYRVSYKLNEWASPTIEGTRLYCFKNLKDATFFAESSHGRYVYECEVLHPRKTISIAHGDSVEEYWTHRLKKEKYGFGILTSAPRGTYSCSKIKLIKKVY